MQVGEVLVLWDAVTRETLIVWNNQVIELPGHFSSKDEAAEAAMAHCRNVGLTEDEAL
jgi:hypothetical protein